MLETFAITQLGNADSRRKQHECRGRIRNHDAHEFHRTHAGYA